MRLSKTIKSELLSYIRLLLSCTDFTYNKSKNGYNLNTLKKSVFLSPSDFHETQASNYNIQITVNQSLLDDSLLFHFIFDRVSCEHFKPDFSQYDFDVHIDVPFKTLFSKNKKIKSAVYSIEISETEIISVMRGLVNYILLRKLNYNSSM